MFEGILFSVLPTSLCPILVIMISEEHTEGIYSNLVRIKWLEYFSEALQWP